MLSDRQTDRHDEANSCFSQFLRTSLKWWVVDYSYSMPRYFRKDLGTSLAISNCPCIYVTKNNDHTSEPEYGHEFPICETHDSP